MTRVIAGGCLLGGAELREDHADRQVFWVPSFEVVGVAPSAFKPGDTLEIPPSVAVHPSLEGTKLRVVSRSWLLVGQGRHQAWSLMLLCCDADPDESLLRYRAALTVSALAPLVRAGSREEA